MVSVLSSLYGKAKIFFFSIALSLTLLTGGYAAEPNKELNLYSARHYQTDEALYANFTKSTGIKINR
ncbi:MAG: hypothetical protein EB080_05640, partial [Burkholderiaceae bacterium]|nr:hypothetical protein [Burkholderiaceae bacterium]